MDIKAEEFDNNPEFRLLQKVSYNNMAGFALDYLRRGSAVTFTFFGACLVFLVAAVTIRINLAAYYSGFLLHSLLGFIVFPLIIIPVHEILHIIPYYICGARDIRAGVDLRQYMFYVTAHRYVAGALQFITVAVFPLFLLSVAAIALIFILPGLWKWSISAFLFTHATMCAGDIALINLYYLNRGKKIYTWDDADKKEAYFYEKLT